MPDASDRDRGIAGYVAEIRAFHTFFGAVLLAVGAFHLLVLLPFIQVRAALPAVAEQARAVESEFRAVDQVQQTATAAVAAVAQFRRAMATAPEQLRRTIAELVARGRTLAGSGGDPYKVNIRVPREGTQPGSGPSDEEITVEGAIRGQIGKQMEALSLSFEKALEPLRTATNTPAGTLEILREAQETIGREIQVDLNKILQDAFGADPTFWQRWERQATFGAVSTRAEETTRRIDEALRIVLDRLAKAAGQARNHQQELQTRLEGLRTKERVLTDRLERIVGSTARVPLAPEEWARLYPVVVGALTLTVLFRLRRILIQRRALTGIDLDQFAPSWVVGSSSSPGRLWSLVLVVSPLAAVIHASAYVVTDPGLFVTALGESSTIMTAAYGVAYAALILTGLWQLVLVTRVVLALPQKRPSGHGGR